MATPILKIPVDDAAFKKFIDTFQKYQIALGEQTSAWAEINDALTQMTENIEQQKEAAAGLTEEEKKRADALKHLADQQRQHDKEQETRDKEAAKRREHAIAQVKEYARGVASAAMSLTKWVSIDSAVAFGGSMLSMYGLDRFANYAGDARRQASGMGVSIGQMQRASVAMSPYFNAESTIDRVANMAGDPTQLAPFMMMGINPRGKDPGELTLQAAARARSMFTKDKGNLAIAEAQGLTQIFSPEELRRMAHESNADFSANQNLARQASANRGLDDKTARKWQQFTMTLDNAGYSLKNQLIDKLTTLVGPLTKLEGAFVHLVEGVLTKTNLDNIASGIESFVKWINSPDFQNGFKRFTSDIVVIAQKIDDALVYFKLIPSQQSNQPVGPGTAGLGRDTRSWWSEPIGGDDGSSFKIYSNDAYQRVGRILMGERNRDQAHARAILTNMVAESDLDPFAKGDKVNGKPTAYGIGQWHESFYPAYKKMFGHSIFSVKNRAQALREQTIFYDKTLRGHSGDPKLDAGMKSVGEQFDRLSDTQAAAAFVSSRYEVAAGQSGVRSVEAARRGRAALGAPNIVVNVNNQTGHSVAITANSAAGG